MYKIEIRANFNQRLLATWLVPDFLVSSIADVQNFVKDHIYKCPLFVDCYCCVLESEDLSYALADGLSCLSKKSN